MRECTSEHMSGCDDNEVKEMRKIKKQRKSTQRENDERKKPVILFMILIFFLVDALIFYQLMHVNYFMAV